MGNSKADIEHLQAAFGLARQTRDSDLIERANAIEQQLKVALNAASDAALPGDADDRIEGVMGRSISTIDSNLRVDISAHQRQNRGDGGGMSTGTIMIIVAIFVVVILGVIFGLYLYGQLPGIEAPKWFTGEDEDVAEAYHGGGVQRQESFYPSVQDITDQATLGLLDRLNGCHGHATGDRPVPSKIEGTVPRFGVGSFDQMDMGKRLDRSTEQFVETNSRYNNRILPRASWVSSM